MSLRRSKIMSFKMPWSRLPSVPEPPATKQAASLLDSSDTPPRLFALIIGIDNYSQYPLQGAVADSRAVQKYLEYLRVPKSQIVTLRDTQATRRAIIDAFLALADNPKIRRDDPILIYYAGHGGRGKAHESMHIGSTQVQMIVPQDYTFPKSEIVNGEAEEILAIADYVQGVLIDRICKEKGDNITVIYDCCYSASGTHINTDNPTRHSRAIPYVVAGDDPDVVPRDSILNVLAQYRAVRSYVHLAACGATETAVEVDKRGAFTSALLEALYRIGADKMTYAEILTCMRAIAGQNPRCTGEHVNRIFFDSKARVRQRRCRVDLEDSMLDAGRAEGITQDSVFEIYAGQHTAEDPVLLGLLQVTRTSTYESNFRLLDPTPASEGLYAVQRRAAIEELLLSVANEELRLLVNHLLRTQNVGMEAWLVGKDRARYALSMEDGQVAFETLDPNVTRHGLQRLPHTVKPDGSALLPVLRAMAHFDWHVRRVDSSGKNLASRVQLEFFKLKMDTNTWLWRPVGADLNNAGVVALDVDNPVTNYRAIYGMRLTNRSYDPVYPYVFFFDCNYLSIESYYVPRAAFGSQNPEVPALLPDQSLAIGYGERGNGYSYSLKNRAVGCGFLKVFLSAQPLDVKEFRQPSPFTIGREGVQHVRRIPGVWDSIVVTLVQTPRT